MYQHYRFVQHTVSDCALFFEIIVGSEKIVGAVVYVPPENSMYYNRLVFDELEESLLYFDTDRLVLFGDFNARTASSMDFLEIDVENEDRTFVEELDLLEMFDIKKIRASCDKITNNHGNRLLEICKTQLIYIVNGRVDRDKDIGRPTCKDVSVVDYIVAAPYIFPFISKFHIDDFNRVLSDAHCALFLDLEIDIPEHSSETQNSNLQSSISKPSWLNDKKDAFVDHILQSDLTLLHNELSNLANNPDIVHQNKIDSLTKDVTDVMLTAATNVGLIKTFTAKRLKKIRKTNKKPWFDQDCRQRRADYRRAQRRHKRHKNKENEDVKKAYFRIYKNTVNYKYNNHRKNLHKSIRNLRSKDPKQYHKILNESIASSNKPTNIPTDEEFIAHFEKLGNLNEEDLLDADFNFNIPNLDTNELNKDISIDEIKKCLNRLNNNKANGSDLVINEYLKAAPQNLIEIITNLFNLILKTGKVPKNWSLGTISPLYKGKGDSKNTDNYRGITILSCFGKLFTSVLNDRIHNFLECNKLLGWEQGGFRKHCSTTDQVFTLHCLLDLYLKRKKKLFCTFIDYRKAFDLVQRDVLWSKLLRNGISGRILNVIKDLYGKAKCCVKTQTGTSASVFTCNVGLKQGENLSPILFSLFLNDLNDYLVNHNVSGLSLTAQIARDLDFDDIDTFIRLFLLLYADDTIVLAENEKDLQKALNVLYDYCISFGMSINVSKTKIIVFSRGKIRNLPTLIFNGEQIEVVFEYKYLGTLFTYNNKFQKTINAQCMSAKRALFALLKKCRKLDLPLDLQIELFDRCIVPIMLYNCEVWGHEKLDQLEKLQLKFYKLILGVKSSTPTCMVLGEVGQLPISLIVKSRLLCFWYKLTLESRSDIGKYSIIMLKLNKRMTNRLGRGDANTLQWLEFVYSSLDSLGLTYIWQTSETVDLSLFQFKNLIKKRIKDQYIQTWKQTVFEKDICISYRIFKTDFCFENYLNLHNTVLRKTLTKFRLSSHNLPIQQLRYSNTPRQDRLCTLCDKNEIGDEFHYLFTCSHDALVEYRIKFISRYFHVRPNAYKFEILMNAKSNKKRICLAKFVYQIQSLFR